MAQEENNKKVLEQEGLQIDPTKVTTEQRIPIAVDEQAIRNYDEQIRAIDLSDESIAKAPSILALTQLGKKTTDNYLEQQKRHQKAGKFSAWSQFANALAAFAGGAANGQAMPIQQNYNLPMSSFQKADAYRDAMAQNEERYAQARISAQQNEKARRLQQLNMLIDARQKAVEDAYKYGTTVKTEKDDLTAAKKMSEMQNDSIRADAAKTTADAAKLRAAQYSKYVESKIKGDKNKKRYYTPIATIPNTAEYGPLAGKPLNSVMISSIVLDIKALAEEDPDFAEVLNNDTEFKQRLSVITNPSDINRQDVTWLMKYLKKFPDRFAYIFDYNSNPQNFEYGAYSEEDSNNETDRSDEGWME